jgi:hypothetical protein
VIGDRVFEGCEDLTSIIVDANNTVYSSESGVLFSKDKTTLIQIPAGKTRNYTIPDSVRVIDSRAFSGCNGLTSVIIPISVKVIRANAFYGCSALTSVIIPNSVKFIRDCAFRNCSGLTSVIISDSITSTGKSVFKDSLLSLFIRSKIPRIKFNAFAYVDKNKCTLYVPKGTVSAYKEATGWSSFEHIEEIPVTEKQKKYDK